MAEIRPESARESLTVSGSLGLIEQERYFHLSCSLFLQNCFICIRGHLSVVRGNRKWWHRHNNGMNENGR